MTTGDIAHKRCSACEARLLHNKRMRIWWGSLGKERRRAIMREPARERLEAVSRKVLHDVLAALGG